MIVRIGGLPASSMEDFRSETCNRVAQESRRLRDDLTRIRSELAEKLHVTVKTSPPELRRFLLLLRRDCFNGRSLLGHCNHSEWEVARRSTGALLDSTVALEGALEECESRFEAVYHGEQERQRELLEQLLENRYLRRGIALSSPEFLDEIERPSRHRRVERRREHSALRYVSRAALKTSPYSTLTRVAMFEASGNAVRLVGNAFRERSLTRLKRYLPEQLSARLLRFPTFRSSLRIALNNSIEEIADGRFRFLRAGFWQPENGRRNQAYIPDSLVEVSLGGPLIGWLRRELPSRLMSYAEVLEAVAGETALGDSADATRSILDELLRIGFLSLVFPWSSDEPHLEKRLASYLRSLPEDADLQPTVDALTKLVALQENHAATDDPVRSIREIGQLFDVLASSLGASDTTPRSATAPVLYEDVFLVASNTETDRQEILRVPLGRLQSALANVEPLARLLSLFSPHHDFLLALAAFASRRWPGRQDVGALELFAATQSLWREFLKWRSTVRSPERWTESFDPLALPATADLTHLRQLLRTELEQSVNHAGDESRISTAAVASLTDAVPYRYTSLLGPCVFLQPLDTSGSRWVANRLFEGTGRYGSRYTAVMDEGLRRRYVAGLAGRSIFTDNDEPVELLDLMWPHADTLNVHAVQTSKVLELPGDCYWRATTECVTLRDLRVRLGGESTMPHLTTASGRRLLPVFLGGAAEKFVPLFVRFLLAFGVGELPRFLPPPHAAKTAELTLSKRLTIGSVVLKRKRWEAPIAGLSGKLRKSGGHQEFLAIDRWRSELGIPERVFLIETIYHRDRNQVRKPQYIDFSSPLFVSLFRSTLKDRTTSAIFEEVLPQATAMPRDTQGRNWTIELLLDTLTMQIAPNHRCEMVYRNRR